MGIIRYGNIAKMGQRSPKKELVNGVGSKANKPKGKGCGNWAEKAQKIQQKLMRMKEVGKNEIS